MSFIKFIVLQFSCWPLTYFYLMLMSTGCLAPLAPRVIPDIKYSNFRHIKVVVVLVYLYLQCTCEWHGLTVKASTLVYNHLKACFWWFCSVAIIQSVVGGDYTKHWCLVPWQVVSLPVLIQWKPRHCPSM